jgi:hypothetical protein
MTAGDSPSIVRLTPPFPAPDQLLLAGTRTDIDIAGVRFRHRREHLADRMEDDKWMTIGDRSWAVFVEAKTGTAGINKTWFR